MTKEERLLYLKEYYSEKIMELFADGIPEKLKITSHVFFTGISYEEAETILEYTISQLKKKPVIFNPKSR